MTGRRGACPAAARPARAGRSPMTMPASIAAPGQIRERGPAPARTLGSERERAQGLEPALARAVLELELEPVAARGPARAVLAEVAAALAAGGNFAPQRAINF